jgi:putative membrane protein
MGSTVRCLRLKFSLGETKTMFNTILNSALKAAPTFAAHFGVTLLILIGGVLIYQALTPQNEMKLIRDNNVAAATAFGAAILSLALPLAVCLARSVSIPDIIIWGVVALIVQLGTFFVARLVFHDLVARIERGEMASALALGATHLGVATINAAAIAG